MIVMIIIDGDWVEFLHVINMMLRKFDHFNNTNRQLRLREIFFGS